MADVKSYCSEKNKFMKNELTRIRDIFNSEIFAPGEEKIDLLALTGSEKILRKNSNESINFRQKGNTIFKKEKHTVKDHLKIWNYYSQSIASAPVDSIELAQGFYNRSLFFFHIQKYQESIQDINRALVLEKCDENLKLKMESTKNKCLTKLKKLKNVNKLNNDRMVIPESETEILNKNAKIPCSSNALSIDYNKNFGRFIVADRDIKPGELVVKEKCFSQFILGDEIQRHCSHCCKLVYSSIPCNYCAYAMYCSDVCKNKAWNDYHNIECIIMNKMDIRNKSNELVVFSLRIFLKIFKASHEDFEQLKNFVENIDSCTEPLKLGFSEGMYQSNSYSILSLSMSASIGVDTYVKQISNSSTFCTYWLGTETNTFGKIMKSSKNFLENDNALFFATLLSRIHHIVMTNSFSINEEVDLENRRFRDFIDDLDPENSDKHVIKEIAVGISAFSSLFNHSCTQDVATFVNDNLDTLYFAIKPIKKGSPVCFCYGQDAIISDKSERSIITCKYGFTCKCVACEEDWPTIIDAPKLDSFEMDMNFPRNDYNANLNKYLSELEKFLKNHKLCYKEIYRIYGVIVDLYRARFSKWCQISPCC